MTRRKRNNASTPATALAAVALAIASLALAFNIAAHNAPQAGYCLTTAYPAALCDTDTDCVEKFGPEGSY